LGDLLEVLEERYGNLSTVVTSQLLVDRWHDVIAEPTLADSILDRLVHNAHLVAMDSDPMCANRRNGVSPGNDEDLRKSDALRGRRSPDLDRGKAWLSPRSGPTATTPARSDRMGCGGCHV
jgi:hypothetical protein